MTEYMDIEEKTVLVTGDDPELLYKITDEFALEETHLALTTNYDNYKKIAQYIHDEYDLEVLHAPMNLDDEDSVEESLQKIEDTYGEVDILVNTGERESNEVLIDRLSTRSIYPLFHINKVTYAEDPFEKEDKTVVITGASGRIGEQIAQQYAREKSRLILLSDNEEQLKEDVKKYTRMGVEATYRLTFMEDEKSISESLESILDSYERIDFLVNAAGMGQNKDVVDKLVSMNLSPTFCIVFLQKFHNL